MPVSERVAKMSVLRSSDLANHIEADRLIEQSCAGTGLSNFGDPALDPPFFAMVDAINESAALTPQGAEGRRHHIKHLLSNRLKLNEYIRQNPNVTASEINTPIFIIGLPRSGTTKLHRLMAKDPQFNSTPLWECFSPIPALDGSDDRAERFGYADTFCRALADECPEFFAAHPIFADEPEECHALMQHSFQTESIEAELRIPDHIHWLSELDHTPMYEQHALILRVLGQVRQHPGRPWLLKGVYHAISLDIILALHPSAVIVHCHRDPVDTIASYASLICKMRTMLSDHVDPRQVGPEILAHWSFHLERALEVRDRVPNDRIIDVPYAEIVGDIRGVVEKVYHTAELQLSCEAVEKMTNWDDDNPQHKLGRHRYTAEEYGLSSGQIAEHCSSYRSRFIL